MDGNARHSDDPTLPALPPPRARCGILAIGVLALCGCSGGMRAIDADHARWLDEGDSISARLERLPTETSATPTDIDPASLQGPEDYVQLALARSPAIRAAEARVAMLRERVPQAESLEDPMLMVAPIGEMAETGAGQVGAMTSLSQKLPLGDKLDVRGQIAEREAGQARADLARARVDLAGDVRRAYWAYVLSGRTIRTTLESRALFVQFRDVADAQYRSGEREQQDVLRAAAELGSIDTELARMTQQRDSAAAALRRFIAAPRDLVLPEPNAVASERVAARREELIERASRINPSLRAGAERLGQFEARQRLAHLERWPDLTLSLSYNFVSNEGLAPSRTGDDQWWVGLGVNLPIWRQARRRRAGGDVWPPRGRLLAGRGARSDHLRDRGCDAQGGVAAADPRAAARPGAPRHPRRRGGIRQRLPVRHRRLPDAHRQLAQTPRPAGARARG
ncbi:MAG: TolC family protein [Phycisphaerales bacterium]|nr:TolC family protein [Phycisphaerales bacterium]